MTQRNPMMAIDYETADRITCASLIDHRSILKGELDKFVNGGWMHPNDVLHNTKLVEAMDLLIEYHGGDVK